MLFRYLVGISLKNYEYSFTSALQKLLLSLNVVLKKIERVRFEGIIHLKHEASFLSLSFLCYCVS